MSNERETKRRKLDDGSAKPAPRVTRAQARYEELARKAPDPGVLHFGSDVSGKVKQAMAQGGSLDESSRRTMRGDIERSKRIVKAPDQVMGKGFSDQLVDQFRKQTPVVQADNRVAPRKGGDYPGAMFTSSLVRRDSFAAVDKEIPRPSSPKPDAGKGYYHATHTSPFALIGPDSNAAKTVNAPSWANITVDGGIEKGAKQAVAKFGEGNVFHFRLDTSDRSTVGYAVHDVKAKSEQQRWQVTSAQYKRKDL